MSIVTIPQHSEFFLCYSAKEASICRHSHDNNNIGQLQIVKRFFKVSAIKSILSNLMIQKIVIRPKLITNTTISDATGYTLAVLVNDDSLYIYENVRFGDRNDNDGAESNGVSIQLTKHIHPIERRDLHGRHLKNHRTDDMNNSECMKSLKTKTTLAQSHVVQNLAKTFKISSFLFSLWCDLVGLSHSDICSVHFTVR